MTVEYTCEGCGVPVVNMVWNTPPAHEFCAACEWFTWAWRTGAFRDAAEMIEAMQLTGQFVRTRSAAAVGRRHPRDRGSGKA